VVLRDSSNDQAGDGTVFDIAEADDPPDSHERVCVQLPRVCRLRCQVPRAFRVQCGFGVLSKPVHFLSDTSQALSAL